MLAGVASRGGEDRSVARERDAVIADALDEAARVLVRLSARLRALHDSDRDTDRAADKAAAPPPPAPARAERRRAQGLGPRQMAVLALGGLGDELGLAASEVGKALGYTPSNATNILKRLEGMDYVVRVPGERPARWRRPTAGDVA